MDLGSTNGTLLNGRLLTPLQPFPIGPDDILRVAGRDLSFTFTADAQVGVGAAATQQISTCPSGRPEKSLLIGRAPECDIVLSDPDASWRHARLTRLASSGGEWLLEDLQSTNGTFVNERAVSGACRVQSQDRIRIGLNRFRLDVGHERGGARMSITHQSEAGQVCLEASGLTHTVWSSGQPLTLLRNVSLCIRPRELVAIVGASGAGKTTLLMALNGYQPASVGSLLLNGTNLYAHPDLFRTAIGYVPQSDIVHADLRVESALRYAARLRLPDDTPHTEVARLVERVLNELALTHRRDHLIRTLSGGERKRVNIGVELLTRPSLLFLDEPTTGLDAGLERKVTQQLRALADEGRTIVVVTHSVQTIEEFDKVAVMTRGGHLAFFGPPRAALAFFGAQTYAEMYDVAGDPARPEGYWAEQFRRRYDAQGNDGFAVAAKNPVAAHARSASVGPRTSFLRQLSVLLARYTEVIRSDTRNLVLWLAQAPAVALIIALLFDANMFAPAAAQTPDSQGRLPIADAPHLLFLMAFSLVCFGLCNAAREIVKERAVYERERHVALRAGPYLASKAIVLGLVSLCQCLLLISLVSLKISLGVDAGGWFTLLGVLFLGALNAVLLGLVVSAWAQSGDQAITLAALLLLLQVIFSGLVPLERMNTAFGAIASICALRWSYGGLCGVTDLADRWEALGLGRQVGDVFRTQAGMALGVLGACGALALLVAATALTVHDKRTTTRA